MHRAHLGGVEGGQEWEGVARTALQMRGRGRRRAAGVVHSVERNDPHPGALHPFIITTVCLGISSVPIRAHKRLGWGGSRTSAPISFMRNTLRDWRSMSLAPM